MNDLRINVVYRDLPEERLEVAYNSKSALVVWTKEESSGFDVVVYFNGFSYQPSLISQNSGVLRILYISEPLSVYPRHFTRRFWAKFDGLLTWNDCLAKKGGRIHYMPVLSYDYPFTAGHGVINTVPSSLPDPDHRRKALCQIVGDKFSPIIGQLYSLRRKAARWFYKNGKLDMDVYGFPPMRVPNHIGRVESKLDTMGQYRYALCFENLYHPMWSRGYVTEKIYDCMSADCVPVYYGCSNIEEHIPKDCFIDYRQFNSFYELDRFLVNLSDDDYLDYVKNIRSFLESQDTTFRYSCYRLYDKAIELFRSGSDERNSALPEGFFEKAGLKERVAYIIMVCGLKFYRIIHLIFNLLRRAEQCLNR